MRDEMTSWYRMLKDKMRVNGDDFTKMTCTLTIDELKEEFDAGFGGESGKPFTAWGDSWVYFPICYDGAEWVGSAPRNPCDISMDHQGG